MGLEPTISSLGGRRLIHEATRACSQCEQNAHHLGLLLVAPRWRILRAAVCVRPCSCVCACVRACACVVGSDSLQTVEAYSLKIKFGEHELYYTRTSEVLYKKKFTPGLRTSQWAAESGDPGFLCHLQHAVHDSRTCLTIVLANIPFFFSILGLKNQ